MGCCSQPADYPDPAKAATQGIYEDTSTEPWRYLINSAATLGDQITIDGQQYDFSGLGQADVAAKVSDQMAATLLALQKEKSPQLIQQRINELKAADPMGYAARKQLFDRIVADAQANPDRPIAEDLQSQIQTELAKGVGFEDAKQASQARNQIRGGQVARGVILGNAPAAEEAGGMVQAGESLRNQRQQNAMDLLASGTTPEDVAYRRMQQGLSNLTKFQLGETPSAQFQQVSGAASGPVKLTGGATQSGQFNPNAAQQGLSNALGIYSGQMNWNQSQANPWLAGLSIGATGAGTLNQMGAFNSGGWTGGGGAMYNFGGGGSPSGTVNTPWASSNYG